eukprot:3223580-Rhodomonas_salina.1
MEMIGTLMEQPFYSSLRTQQQLVCYALLPTPYSLRPMFDAPYALSRVCLLAYVRNSLARGRIYARACADIRVLRAGIHRIRGQQGRGGNASSSPDSPELHSQRRLPRSPDCKIVSMKAAGRFLEVPTGTQRDLAASGCLSSLKGSTLPFRYTSAYALTQHGTYALASMRGTEEAYVLRACYAPPGTDVAQYSLHPTQSPVCGIPATQSPVLRNDASLPGDVRRAVQQLCSGRSGPEAREG